MLAARRITIWALSIGLLAAFGCDGGQIAELNDQIAKLNADLTVAQDATSQAQADLKAARDESAKAVARMAEFNEQLEALKTAEADAKKLAEQAQAELVERDRTAAQMKAAAAAKAAAARGETIDLKQQVAELTGKLTDAQAALDAAHKEIEALKKKPEGGQP